MEIAKNPRFLDRKVKPGAKDIPFNRWLTWVGWVLAIGLGLLGLWRFHCTELASGFDEVPGGKGDNRFVVSILEYLYQSHLGLGQYFSPFFYFPAKNTLGYSDAYLTHAFLYGWLRNLGWDIFSSYQFCVFAFNLLNYIICLLMFHKGFRFGIAASSFGAFLFAFNAPKFNQISHTQLQCLFWLPLALWAVVSWIRDRHKINQGNAFCLLAIAALALDAEFLTAFYPVWFLLFWTCLFLALSLIVKSTRDFWISLSRKFWRAILGALVVFAGGLVPFFCLYLPVIRDLGGKDYDEVAMMIPKLWCFLWMGSDHGWWGWLGNIKAIQSLPIEGEERIGFGIIIFIEWAFLILVVLWALIKIRQGLKISNLPFLRPIKNERVYFWFAALTVFTTTLYYLLGSQYGNGFSPWWLVYRFVPGAQSIRAVARYVITLALPISAVITFAFHLIFEKALSGKSGITKILLIGGTLLGGGVMTAEQVVYSPYSGFSKKAELMRLEYLSQKLPGQCRVFYVAPAPQLPLEPDYSSTNLQIDAMLISAVRGTPTLNGYSGHSPRNWGLFKLRSPYYEQYVKDWCESSHVPWQAERLEIDR